MVRLLCIYMTNTLKYALLKFKEIVQGKKVPQRNEKCHFDVVVAINRSAMW
jgi:hypothetical protein